MGATGRVIGVEISPDVAVNAKRRIVRHGRTNVTVLVASAQTVELTGRYDGLHMFAAPDVYAADSALANLLPRLRPRARIVFFGAKTSGRRFGWLLNPVLRRLFPKLTFQTTPTPDDAPLQLLKPHLDDFEIEEYFFGWLFLASGILVPPVNGGASRVPTFT